MVDSTLRFERSESKIYPESLENKSHIGLYKIMARDLSTVKRYLAVLALLEMLEEEGNRVMKRRKTRHWDQAKGRHDSPCKIHPTDMVFLPVIR